jgi:hypothetical protein
MMQSKYAPVDAPDGFVTLTEGKPEQYRVVKVTPWGRCILAPLTIVIGRR